jgi:predicted aspartyl protease
MGHVFSEVTLRANGKSCRVNLRVDTGSTYTWVPEKTLHRLGIRPRRRVHFESISDARLTRWVGEATLEHQGIDATTIVVFGKKGDGKVLGVVALESLGLQVDPIHRTLRKTRAVLAL